MDNSLWKRVVASALLLVLTVLAIWLLITRINKDGKADLPVGDIKPVVVEPSEFPDYNSLSILTPLELIKEKDSNAKNINDLGLKKYLEIKGDFSRIYLYVEASVNDKPLTDWDSVYVKFNTEPPLIANSQAGGHLFRPKSLKVPTDNKSTRLLYNTSVVPYLSNLPYSEVRNSSNVNWFEEAFKNFEKPNDIRKIRFDTFISTTERGKIHLIALYYKCAEETPSCYIKIKG